MLFIFFNASVDLKSKSHKIFVKKLDVCVKFYHNNILIYIENPRQNYIKAVS